MELIKRYNRIHKIRHIPYITLGSLLEEMRNEFLYNPLTEQTVYKLKEKLEESMRNRGLDKHFQIIIKASRHENEVDLAVVNPNNKFYPQKECVVIQWN
ncbi:hypothetical protein BN2127_JRS10_00350 [Bacillus subtilis]|nr:hypothetical protein BN2127_JRS10_00350 [Bacillus subtilis]